MLITVFIIDLEDDSCSFLSFPEFCDLLYGARIPSSIMILTIHQIAFFQSHPPIKIARPRLIRCDHIAITIDDGTIIQDIIQIFNFKFSYLRTDNSSARPASFHSTMCLLQYIYQITLLKIICP
jgi:hypothetical protein